MADGLPVRDTTQAPSLVHERVAAARRGENPTVICRMPSGWAVLGDSQFLRGYSLLLPDPVVGHLTDLDEQGRAQFLTDMARIGDALHACTDTCRVNYEILGNSDEALHAHVFPRYRSEPEEYLRAPVWTYPAELRVGTRFDPSVHGELLARLADRLRAPDPRSRDFGLGHRRKRRRVSRASAR